MKIFVQINDKLHDEMEVDAESTIEAVLAKALPAGVPDDATISYRGKSFTNRKLTLSDLNFQNHQKLIVDFKVGPTTDPNMPDAVVEALRSFLRVSAAELSEGEIVFIGVGSYHHSNREDLIRQQQCPASLLEHCLANGVDLNIILIDREFASKPSPGARQIYDLGGWDPLESELGGQVRRYTYSPARLRRACDIWLTVFCTHVTEYRGEGLSSRGTVIAGMSLPSVFAGIEAQGGTLICGNFYTMDRGQYFTLGEVPPLPGPDSIVSNPVKALARK
jgi:hypothetical protein